MTWVIRTLSWVSGFFRADRPQSSARLSAVILTVSASIYMNRQHPEAGVLTAVIGGGVVALLARRDPPPGGSQ